MKFTELAASLKEGIRPIYVLEGEETYFLDHAVSSVRAACEIKEPCLNDLREEGETLKGEKLVTFRDMLYTMPLFDEKRLVRAYEFHPTEREWEIFQSYVEKPSPSTVLLIVNTAQKSNTVDWKKKSGIAYVDCSRADEETLTRWLFALLRRESLSADTDAVARIVRYCALDAARIKRETEKLKLLLGEGGRVTREVVEEHVERDIEYKIYEMTQASARGDFTQFTEILNDLMKKGSDENAVLAALISYYKTLAELTQMRSLSDAEIAERKKMKPYALKKNREMIARLGEEKIRERFLSLYGLSCSTRSGNQTKSGALTAAIAKIFFE